MNKAVETMKQTASHPEEHLAATKAALLVAGEHVALKARQLEWVQEQEKAKAAQRKAEARAEQRVLDAKKATAAAEAKAVEEMEGLVGKERQTEKKAWGATAVAKMKAAAAKAEQKQAVATTKATFGERSRETAQRTRENEVRATKKLHAVDREITKNADKEIRQAQKQKQIHQIDKQQIAKSEHVAEISAMDAAKSEAEAQADILKI